MKICALSVIASLFIYSQLSAQEQMTPLANAKEWAIAIKSSKDGSTQNILFYMPPGSAVDGAAKSVPLLVGLHSWGTDYLNTAPYIGVAKKHGWAFVGPDYRGPNIRPEACASDLAMQDVLDAVNFAKSRARIDNSKIYILGESGGGHMALMMAARFPDLWAGVSAWVPIADLSAWHAESKAAGRNYSDKLEKVCGGAPGKPETDAEYRKRSPLFFLQNAKGLPIDINTGIHDGHTGSVPVSHALRAFNVLAEVNGFKDKKITPEEIDFMVKTEKIHDSLSREKVNDPDRKNPVLFRREAGPVRITIFEGGHEGDKKAALNWLAKQKKPDGK